MKRNLLTISLCTLLALSLGACEDIIPSIDLDEDESSELDDESSEDLEDEDIDENKEEDTSEHTEHSYDEGVVTKEATCTEEGEIIYTCLECGETYTVVIEALGHSYVLTPDETDPSSGHHSVCSVCGEEESSTLIEHSFIYTDNEDGETHTKVCECDYSETEAHALPDTYTDNGDGTHSRSCLCGYTETATHTYSSFDDTYCTGCDHVEAALDISISLSDNEISVTGISEDFNGGALVIPSAYHGYPVTNIAKNAFKNNTDITSVTIPDSVTRIEEGGFYGCSNMESVTFSESSTLNYIDYDGFRGCSSLTSFEVPETVTDTGTYVFQECTSLKTCTFPKEFGTLKNGTFDSCSSLEEFTLPENATSIHSSTFQNCSSLKEITIPSGVTSINEQAFYGCSSLAKINGLEDSQVKTIGKQAFQGCSALIEIKFPSTLSNISGERVFYGCSSLETISIPEECEVTGLGNYFAYKCEKLTDFTIPATVTSIGNYAFEECTSLTGEIVIPDGVTFIDQNTFYGCTGITSVVMGPNVTYNSSGKSIYNNAFNGCTSLTSVVLAADAVLSNTAFWHCESISTVYYYGDSTQWASFGFGSDNGSLSTATAYYYSETSTTNGWHFQDNVYGTPTLWEMA